MRLILNKKGRGGGYHANKADTQSTAIFYE